MLSSTLQIPRPGDAERRAQRPGPRPRPRTGAEDIATRNAVSSGHRRKSAALSNAGPRSTGAPLSDASFALARDGLPLAPLQAERPHAFRDQVTGGVAPRPRRRPGYGPRGARDLPR